MRWASEEEIAGNQTRSTTTDSHRVHLGSFRGRRRDVSCANKRSPQKILLLAEGSKEEVAGNQTRSTTTDSHWVRLGSFRGQRRNVPCANKGSAQMIPFLAEGSIEDVAGNQTISTKLTPIWFISVVSVNDDMCQRRATRQLKLKQIHTLLARDRE